MDHPWDIRNEYHRKATIPGIFEMNKYHRKVTIPWIFEMNITGR
jgi:hypothetical protein